MRRLILLFALVAGCHHDPEGPGNPPDAGVPADAATPPDDLASMTDDGATSMTDGSTTDDGPPSTTDGPPSTTADGGAIGPGACIEDGWCWERPLLFGATLHGVWGSSFSDVWAVGDGGTILHFDGASWTRLTPITPEPLYHVHGSGPTDVWAVGRHVILHFDGTRWSIIAAPATKGLLRTVFARAADDVWFAGDWFALMHYDGAKFTLTEETTTQAARALISFARDDVWAVGDNAFVRHFDGKTWKWTGADFSNYPNCVSAWGTAANNIYLGCGGGTSDTVQHWDGAAWHRVRFPSGVEPGPTIIAGSSASDIWLLGGDWHSASFDGNTWTRHQELEDDALADAWLDKDGRGFAVGGGGRILRRDGGASWTAMSGTKGGVWDSLGGVFAVADDDIWAVGRLTLLRFDGKRWNEVPPAMTTYRQEFGAVWASGPNDAWIVGWGDFPNSVQRWNGTAFTVFGPRPDLQGYVDDVWGTAADDVWIVNDAGDVMHWDGQKLSFKYSNPGGGAGVISGIHGTGRNDVWTFGSGLRHWDGKELKPVALPPLPMFASLRAVHALAADDVWVTADDGVVLRWNGSSWTTPPSPPIRADDNGNRYLAGFAGTSANDLWAVGTEGDIFQFDGTKWRKSVTVGVGIGRLARTPHGNLIAVGGSGAILRRR